MPRNLLSRRRTASATTICGCCRANARTLTDAIGCIRRGRSHLGAAWAFADHVAGWVSGMACCPEILDVHNDGFAENVKSYYQLARAKDLFITYAIVPPASVKSANSVVTIKQTSLPTSKWGEQAGLQVVGEKDNGIVVSGFKVLATGAILADEILFGNFQALAQGNERFAATFALPVILRGLHCCRVDHTPSWRPASWMTRWRTATTRPTPWSIATTCWYLGSGYSVQPRGHGARGICRHAGTCSR